MVNARRLRPYHDGQIRDEVPSTADSNDPTKDRETDTAQDSCGVQSLTQPQTPEQATDVEPELYEVEKILTTKMIQGKRKYRIKWKNYRDPTWEPEEHIPTELLKEYYKTHTKQGKRRKRGNVKSAFHRK